MRLNFIQSGFVRSTEEERRQSELKKASLQFQLKQLENCLDSQISIWYGILRYLQWSRNENEGC